MKLMVEYLLQKIYLSYQYFFMWTLSRTSLIMFLNYRGKQIQLHTFVTHLIWKLIWIKKIIIFRNGGPLRHTGKWLYKSSPIEVVSLYKYLGMYITPKLYWSKSHEFALTHSVLAPPYGVGKNMIWTPSAAIWRRGFKNISSLLFYMFPVFDHLIGLNLNSSQLINLVYW